MTVGQDIPKFKTDVLKVAIADLDGKDPIGWMFQCRGCEAVLGLRSGHLKLENFYFTCFRCGGQYDLRQDTEAGTVDIDWVGIRGPRRMNLNVGSPDDPFAGQF